jgi:hypothetical protein
MKRICESEEFFGSLQINACDSSYGVAKYISKMNGINNLVNIIRLRHGNKVDESESLETGGAPQIYGKQYYLLRLRKNDFKWNADTLVRQIFEKNLTVLNLIQVGFWQAQVKCFAFMRTRVSAFRFA